MDTPGARVETQNESGSLLTSPNQQTNPCLKLLSDVFHFNKLINFAYCWR